MARGGYVATAVVENSSDDLVGTGKGGGSSSASTETISIAGEVQRSQQASRGRASLAPAVKVGGARRSLRRRMRDLSRQFGEIREFMANQAHVNEELAHLVKETLKGKAISPGAASNSPAGRRSVAQQASSKKRGTEVTRPPLRTYKRRRTLTSSATRDDPTYVPPVTPLSSDDTGTFYYTRSNKRSTTSAKKSSGISRKGKRNLFPTNKGQSGIPPPDSSYLTSSPDKCRRYVDAMNFLQVRSRDTSRWVDEIGATLHSGVTMTFRPTEDMKIVGLDLAAAAYIFCPNLNQEDIMVPSPHCHLSRSALRSLEPGKLVDENVLTMLSIMLTHNSTRKHWFLPTSLVVTHTSQIHFEYHVVASYVCFSNFFSQKIGTSRCPLLEDTIAYIRKSFMGKADEVYKVPA